MTTPNIDDTGFHSLGLNGWLAQLISDYQSIYGTDIDVSTSSPDGQWLGLLAGHFANLEQLALNVYNGRSPVGAVGAGLSRLVLLNGIARKSAQFSTAPITLTGTPGTVIPSGALIASNSDPTKPPFATTATLTIGGGGTVTGTAQCTVAGPIPATSSPPELTVIQTVVSGWTSVANTADAAPGMLVEADPALRIRRASSVAMPSQSLRDGLEAALANLSGVSDVVVYENRTETTDAKGLPPHSINAIVLGGTNLDIATAIWTKASMGVTQVGGHVFTITDAQGNPQLMQWDTPSDEDVYITVNLNATPNSFLTAAIQNAIVAYYSPTGDLPAHIGQNIFWADLFTPINALGLTGKPGLPSVTSIYLGSAATPTLQQDLFVPYNARAVFDPSRILVLGP